MACQCVYAVEQYRRPRLRYAGRLPDAPVGQRKLHACWESLRPYITFSIVVQAFVLILVVLAGTVVLALTVPILRMNFISFWIGVADSVVHLELRPESFYFHGGLGLGSGGSGSSSLLPVQIICTAAVAYLLVTFARRFPEYAMREEQAFRQGAEDWSPAGRVRSFMYFGSVHWGNFIYPVAVVVMIAFSGVWYLALYLKRYRQTRNSEAATYASTALHTMYNVFALGFAALWFMAIIWM